MNHEMGGDLQAGVHLRWFPAVSGGFTVMDIDIVARVILFSLLAAPESCSNDSDACIWSPRFSQMPATLLPKEHFDELVSSDDTFSVH